MGNYNCVCVCKGEADWPLERNAESVNMKTAGNAALKGLDPSALKSYCDIVSIASNDITDTVSQDVPFPQQVANKDDDDDKPGGTKELTDAGDKSQASVVSNCSSDMTAEEEDPENIKRPLQEEDSKNINAHNQ